MADCPKHNLDTRGYGRGRSRARRWERSAQNTQLKSQHGRNIQYLATESTAFEPRPGQRSCDATVYVKDEVKIHDDKTSMADVATPKQGTVMSVHGNSIFKLEDHSPPSFPISVLATKIEHIVPKNDPLPLQIKIDML